MGTLCTATSKGSARVDHKCSWTAYRSGGLHCVVFPVRRAAKTELQRHHDRRRGRGVFERRLRYLGVCLHRDGHLLRVQGTAILQLHRGWLLHTGWDVLHHLYGDPIVPFAAGSSFGCAICDPVIALWCFVGALSVYDLLRRRRREEPGTG